MFNKLKKKHIKSRLCLNISYSKLSRPLISIKTNEEMSVSDVKNPGFGVRKNWVQIMAQPHKFSHEGHFSLVEKWRFFNDFGNFM